MSETAEPIQYTPDFVFYPPTAEEPVGSAAITLGHSILVRFYADGRITIDPSFGWTTSALLFMQIMAVIGSRTDGKFADLHARLCELQKQLEESQVSSPT